MDSFEWLYHTSRLLLHIFISKQESFLLYNNSNYLANNKLINAMDSIQLLYHRS